MNEIVVTPERLGQEIRELTRQAKAMTLYYGVEIGRRLKSAKEMVQYGTWGDWIKENTEFSQATASRFMRLFEEYGASQIGIFGAEVESSTLQNLSISNALRLLAVPEEEREAFAEAVDAENLSARELEQAIRERDEARKALEAERQAGEGAALRLADVTSALAAEREKTAALKDRAAAQAEKIQELENRPVEVAVQAADPAEVEKAVTDALAAAEKKYKADLMALEKQRKAAEKRQTELQAESAKAMADLKNSNGRAEDLTRRVEQLQAELAAAKENAAKLQKADAIQSDADIAVFQSFFQAVQENFNRACGLMQKVKARDAEKAAKLARFSRDALAKMSALVEKEV